MIKNFCTTALLKLTQALTLQHQLTAIKSSGGQIFTSDIEKKASAVTEHQLKVTSLGKDTLRQGVHLEQEDPIFRSDLHLLALAVIQGNRTVSRLKACRNQLALHLHGVLDHVGISQKLALVAILPIIPQKLLAHLVIDGISTIHQHLWVKGLRHQVGIFLPGRKAFPTGEAYRCTGQLVGLIQILRKDSRYKKHRLREIKDTETVSQLGREPHSIVSSS